MVDRQQTWRTADGGTTRPIRRLLATVATAIWLLAAPPAAQAIQEVPGSPFQTDPGSAPLTFSPSSTRLAVVNSLSAVTMFSVDPVSGALGPVPGSPFAFTGSPDNPLGEPMHAAAFSPDGTLLVVSEHKGLSDGTLSVLAVDPVSGALTEAAGSPYLTNLHPNSVSFSPDGRLVAAANVDGAGDEGTVSLFSVDEVAQTLTQVPGSPFPAGRLPTSVAFGPGGSLVAVANVVGDVELDPTLVGGVTVLSVDPLTKALTKVPSAPFATGRPLSAMASSPTAGLLATANGIDGTASVLAIDVSTGALNEVPGSPFSVPQRPYALAFSLHGGLLATANGGSPEGPSLSLFSVDNATGALTGVSISPLAASPRALTFSPNGKLLATGSPHDGYVSVFAVNSTGPPSTIATLSGRVTADGSAAAGALVQVCRVGAGSCQLRSTGLDGRYSVSVLDGSYQLTAFPPQDSSRAEGFAGPVTVHGADVTQDLALGPNPTPPPTNTTVSGFGTTPDGVPVVSWLLPFTLTTHGCGGGSASYEVRVEASVVRSGRLAEVSAGTYSVTVAELYPSRGQGAIHISIVCPDPAQNRTIDFSIYIDPSGRVTNSLGAPVRGATVVLLRSETPDGPFATVPNGSALMSPANRTNPDQSRVDGLFGWDVVAGYYKVRASKPSCVSMADHSASFTESPVLKIPPPVTDLVLRLYCGERPAGPRISDLRMRPSPFRVAGARNTARTTRRHASGSRIRFKLSARANVSFTFAVRTMGRRAGSACVKRTTSNRTRKPCVRYVAKGVLKRRAVASGATSIRFSGRIHARRLAPGRYRLAARPKSAAGVKGKQATASFRIVRR